MIFFNSLGKGNILNVLQVLVYTFKKKIDPNLYSLVSHSNRQCLCLNSNPLMSTMKEVVFFCLLLQFGSFCLFSLMISFIIIASEGTYSFY